MVATSSSIFDGSSPLQSSTALILFQMMFIITTCALLGKALKFFRQPRVVAEVIGGILLGPTVLGQIPGYMERIFPSESLENLSTLAEVGLIFFLFIVGLEMDFKLMTMNVRQSVAITVLGTTIPFAVGWVVAWIIMSILPDDVPSSYGTFGLFVAVCFCITAFPVLARILSAFHLSGAPLGVTALSAAAMSDVIAWGLLALVIAIASSGAPITALYVVLCNGAFTILMFLVIRPAMAWLLTYSGHANAESGEDKRLSYVITTVVFLLVLFASWMTQILGVDAIFGAFITGLIIPRMGTVPLQLMEVTETLVSIVLLPLYFAASGLKTDLTLLNSWTIWGMTLLVLLAVTISKVGPVMVVFRWMGGTWNDSIAAGFLMNTKGLVELIVLNIGLQNNIISPTIFGILVLMSLITTFMTSPIVSFLCIPSKRSVVLAKDNTSTKSAKMVESTDELGAVLAYATHLQTSRMHIALHMSDTGDTLRFTRFLSAIFPQTDSVEEGMKLHAGETQGIDVAQSFVNAVGRFQIRPSITERVPVRNTKNTTSGIEYDNTSIVMSVQQPSEVTKVDLCTRYAVQNVDETKDVHNTIDVANAAEFRMNLCAIHIVESKDTYAGVTYATSYFPNSSAVTDFQENCRQLGIPSYPYIAMDHGGSIESSGSVLAEVVRMQHDFDTIVLAWDRNHRCIDTTAALKMKKKVEELSHTLRTCVYLERATAYYRQGVNQILSDLTNTQFSEMHHSHKFYSVETVAEALNGIPTILVPFVGGEDGYEAVLMAVQLAKASGAANVHVIDYTPWLYPDLCVEHKLKMHDRPCSIPDSTAAQSAAVRDIAFINVLNSFSQQLGSLVTTSVPSSSGLHDIATIIKDHEGTCTAHSCIAHFVQMEELIQTSVLIVCGSRPRVSTLHLESHRDESEIYAIGPIAAQMCDSGIDVPVLSVRASDLSTRS
eukprot:CFRG7432T1